MKGKESDDGPKNAYFHWIFLLFPLQLEIEYMKN